jgi:hypothetical protein
MRLRLGFGVLDRKLRHVEEIGLRGEQEDGVLLVHAHSGNLKKRMILVFIYDQGEKMTV